MIRRTSVRRAIMAVGGRVRVLPLRRRNDAGMVLLETALSIPMLTAVAVLLAWALNVGATSLALGDAARAAARDVARGESVDDALARAGADHPTARVHVESGAESVVIVMTQEVRAPVPGLGGLPVTVRQQVAIPKEWT